MHQPHVAVGARGPPAAARAVGPTSLSPRNRAARTDLRRVAPRSDAVAAAQFDRGTMPWQTAPGVVIIVAAFSVSGMAIPLIHKLIKGEKRVIGRDDFDFLMAKRDKRLAAEKKEGFAK